MKPNKRLIRAHQIETVQFVVNEIAFIYLYFTKKKKQQQHKSISHVFENFIVHMSEL